MNVAVTIVCVTPVLYVIYNVCCAPDEEYIPEEPQVTYPPAEMPDPERIFTKEELAKYGPVKDGEARIYLGCKGIVFDVTESGFYCIGGPYEKLAGRDSSIALSTMKLVCFVLPSVCVCVCVCVSSLLIWSFPRVSSHAPTHIYMGLLCKMYLLVFTSDVVICHRWMRRLLPLSLFSSSGRWSWTRWMNGMPNSCTSTK